MSTNRVLDSSPVPIPSLRNLDAQSRPLKRSASVASLPTPPRTRHKRSRSRARSSTSRHGSDNSGSASELDDDLGGGYAGSIKRAKTRSKSKSTDESHEDHTEDENPDRKKRRTLEALPGHDEQEDDENAFWTGRGGSSCHEKGRRQPEAEKESDNSPSPGLLRYRVTAPVSPPPSRRQPQIQPARAASVERADSRPASAGLVTPPRRLFLRAPTPSAVDAFKTPTKPKVTKILPKRDSPDNPFLVGASEKKKLCSEWDSDEEEVIGEARAREGTPTPAPTFEEKPTITYVFRGQKATFQNPLYGLPPELIAATKLPMEHPDYEAAEACPPKRLFSLGGKRKTRNRSRESTSSEGIKRAKIYGSNSDRDNATASEGERSSGSTESRKKKLLFVDGAEREAVLSKPVRESSSHRYVAEKDAERLESLHHAREERERRETAAKARLGSREGLRAGAVVTERDDPTRRAMGPHRND